MDSQWTGMYLNLTRLWRESNRGLIFRNSEALTSLGFVASLKELNLYYIHQELPIMIAVFVG